MKTIKFEFSYESKTYKTKAILTDDLELTDAKQNETIDLLQDVDGGARWSLCFEDLVPGCVVEIVMYRDAIGEMTTEAEYAIIWDERSETIEAEIEVKSTMAWR